MGFESTMEAVAMKTREITIVMKKAKKLLGIVSGAALASLMPFQQLLAAVISDVSFNSLPGDQIEIRLDFDEAPPEPKGYTIQQPARIALDLPGVKSELKEKKHTLDFGNAQSVIVLESGGRTRVIVNLVELTGYDTRVEGNSLFVVIGNAGAGDYLKATQSDIEAQFADSDSDQAITSLDFQRGEGGEGKLLLGLSDPNVAVDVTKEGRYIKLAFPGVALPEELQRNYDVVDFSTPVNNVKATYADGVSVIQLEPTGEFDYLAYQMDDTYVLSVRPLSEEEVEQRKSEFMFTGEKLSLNFQDIEVRAVLQLIADFTELNLVASDTVNGKITLRLQNVPWDQALELVLKTKGLDKRQVGNVLMVAPADEIAERERREIETNKQIEELAPLQTEHVQILYADAADIFTLFESSGSGSSDAESTGSILSPRGSVIVDQRTNSLLVTETPAKLEEVRRLIRVLDIPIKQVMVEARIVIANSDFSKEIGIRWGGATKSDGGTLFPTTVSSGNLNAVNNWRTTALEAFEAGQGAPEILYPDALFVDLGVSGAGASSFAMSYIDDRLNLSAELSALEATGRGEIVSQPKVITGDKQQATIKAGQQVPFQESSSSGRTTVSFKDAVLKLDVTPNITPDDRIIMDLIITQDQVGDLIAGEFGSSIPIIDTVELVNQVLVENGETVVLGGIFQLQDLNEVTKTPFLGDIPYLGRLFKKTVEKQEKTETLIFITPRILSDKLLD